MNKLLGAVLVAIVAIFPSFALAVPATVGFGNYFLTSDEVAKGLWHFQISLKAPDNGVFDQASPMLAPRQAGQEIWSNGSGRFKVSQVAGRPVLTITEPVGDSSESEVFSIYPYDPEGQLSGLRFFSDRSTHLVGLGADFSSLTDMGMNLLGQVVLPGGPFGNQLMQSFDGGKRTQLQVPICYAMGAGLQSGAIFINETRPLMWDFSGRPWTISLAGPLGPGNGIDFYIVTGEDLPSLRRTFMDLIGRSPVPPKSVFNPWIMDQAGVDVSDWSSHFKELATKVLEIAQTATIIVPTKLDNPPLVEATASGLELVMPESPYIPVDSPNFGDLEKRGFLVRDLNSQGRSMIVDFRGVRSGLLDYTDPAAASYWHSLGRSDRLIAGARNFYLTGGEPEEYSSQAWYRGVGEEGVHSHYAWGNRFSLKWMEGFWTGMANQRFPMGLLPRVFLLSRSGLGGIGRYGGGLYTLEPQLFDPKVSAQARNNLVLSGINYYASDVSSLNARWPIKDPNFRPMYESWLAKNVFLNFPLILPQEFLNQPWVKPNIQRRGQLKPYYYSLAYEAYLTGEPMVAPLLYYFQADPDARERSFETMVGPSLLVAAGVEGGQETLSFYLPKGRWYDINNGEVIDQLESGLISLPCKIDGYQVPPLLLRSGAILPMLERPESSDSSVIIRAFPGEGPSSFNWYEDNGENLIYQRGERLKTVLELNPGPDGLKLTIKAREGHMLGAPSRNLLVEILGLGSVGTMVLDGQIYSRVAQESELDEFESGWSSSGTGRFFFKMPFLDPATDHVLIIN